MNTELKTRAKRLGNAISTMFNIPITHAQSLELVAKEENYPNWDAACKCYGKKLNVGLYNNNLSQHLIEISSDQVIKRVFAENENILSTMLGMLDPDANSGALLLFSGTLSQGKTTTLHAVIENAAKNYKGLDILHVGLKEYIYSEAITARHVTHLDLYDINGMLDFPAEHYIVIDEIYIPETASAAIRLAAAGFVVLTTIHGNSPELALGKFVMEASKVNAEQSASCMTILDKSKRCVVLHQHMSKADDVINLTSNI